MYPAISIETADHYNWGGTADGSDSAPCDGWHLLRTPELSIIEERMPPGTAERRHLHYRARQFFYVLSGELTLEVNGESHILTLGQGLEIAPGTPHQAINSSGGDTRFLITSQPPSHGDRIDAPRE